MADDILAQNAGDDAYSKALQNGGNADDAYKARDAAIASYGNASSNANTSTTDNSSSNTSSSGSSNTYSGSSGSNGTTGTTNTPSIASQITPTTNNLPSTGSGMAGLGSMYQLIPGTNMYSTNPSNPNAERFYSNGAPVGSLQYSNQQTGQNFNGFVTPDQQKQLSANENNAAAENDLISNWLKNGSLSSTYGMPNANLANTLTQAVTNPNNTAVSTGTGQAKNDIPTFQGSSYESAADIAKQLGVDYKEDPMTGRVTIGGKEVPVVSRGPNGSNVAARDVANALGYDIGYDDKTNQVTITGKSSATPASGTGTPTDVNDPNFLNQDPQTRLNTFAQNPNLVPAEMQRIQQAYDAAKARGDQAGMAAAQAWANQVQHATGTANLPANQQGSSTPYLNQPPVTAAAGATGATPVVTQPDMSSTWTNYLNNQNFQVPGQLPIQQQFTPDWTNYYSQAHAQIDPLYNTQYNALMSKQAGDITGMDQKMNARGIFTSGIAQAAENDLRAKTTNSVASLFNKQMSDIEKTAQGLYNNALKEYNTGNSFALKYNQDQINNYMNQQKQVFTQWLQTQKLDLSQQQYALNAWDKMATMQLNQMKATLPYEYQTANNAANNATSAANNAANNQTKTDIALLPYQSMTVYQQASTQEKQQMDAAINYFKQIGVNINEAKLMESITHDRNTEGLEGQKITASLAMNSAQLQEKVHYDKAMIDKASATSMTDVQRLKLDTYKTQLSNVTRQIGDYVNAGHPEQIPPGLMSSYNNIMDEVANMFPGASGNQVTSSSDYNPDIPNTLAGE